MVCLHFMPMRREGGIHVHTVRMYTDLWDVDALAQELQGVKM